MKPVFSKSDNVALNCIIQGLLINSFWIQMETSTEWGNKSPTCYNVAVDLRVAVELRASVLMWQSNYDHLFLCMYWGFWVIAYCHWRFIQRSETYHATHPFQFCKRKIEVNRIAWYFKFLHRPLLSIGSFFNWVSWRPLLKYWFSGRQAQEILLSFRVWLTAFLKQFNQFHGFYTLLQSYALQRSK